MEAREVIGEKPALAHPLSVDLAPARLRPARLGNREMKSVPLDLMPVLRRHVVSQRVEVAVERHLRIAGRARREEHQHRILPARRIGTPPEHPRKADILLIKAAPARALAVHNHLDDARRAQLLHRQFRLMRHVAVGRADERLHVRRLEAVGEVMLQELAHGRDHDRADLVKREDCRPELVMALQHQHHLVTTANALRKEVVGDLVRGLGNLLERETALGEVVGNVQERKLLRILLRDLVHDVVREVELLRVLEVDVLQAAAVVLDHVDVLLHHERRLVRLQTDRLQPEVRVAVCSRHHHRDEREPALVRGDHAVRRRRLVVDRVALLETLDVVADPDQHRALEDDVELLTRVRRRVNRLVQKRLVELVSDPVGRAETVLEHRRLVADRHEFLGGRHRTLPRARHLITRQVRGMPFQQLVDVHAERNRALVKKIEGRINFRRLDALILRFGNARLLRHLGDGVADDFAHFANARGHFLKFQSRVFCLHIQFLLNCNWILYHKFGRQNVKPTCWRTSSSARLSYLTGRSFSCPFMYGRSTSGIVTDPSAFWCCSRSATIRRGSATPEPFSVWTSFVLPSAASLKRQLRRRA